MGSLFHMRRSVPLRVAANCGCRPDGWGLCFLILMLALCPSASHGAGFAVEAWGLDLAGESSVPPGLSNVVEVAAGGCFSLALTVGGRVLAWGDNRCGQTNVPSDLTNAVAIAAGRLHCLALRSDGSVVAWGYNQRGQANVPKGLTNVVAIAAGFAHSLALRTDGTVAAWGAGITQRRDGWEEGQCMVPADLTNAVAIAAGWMHSLALKADGTVAAWGNNEHGQINVPQGLNDAMAVSAASHATYVIRKGRTVLSWGRPGMLAPVAAGAPVLTNVAAIAGGHWGGLALTGVGRLLAWGRGAGIWPTNQVSSSSFIFPVLGMRPLKPCPLLTNAVFIAAGYDHFLALVGPAGRPPIPTFPPKRPPFPPQRPFAMNRPPDSVLKFWLSKSDLVVAGKFTSTTTGGKIHEFLVAHLCGVEIEEVLKGDPKLKAKNLQVNIVRPLKTELQTDVGFFKDSQCILFLKKDANGPTSFVSTEVGSVVLHPNASLVRDLKEIAGQK
jgi:hypothetical protein